MLTIEPVRSRGDLRAFLNLPDRLYASNPAWIAPLRVELKQRLNQKKNPYFRQAESEYFLARQGGDVVGRITVQIDHAAHPGDAPSEAHFGFYEAVNEPAVAAALYGAATDWARARRAKKIVGPYNFRLEDPAPGFLTDGFDVKPTFMMAYSQPYYVEQALANGFTEAMELRSYAVGKDDPALIDFAERAQQARKIPGMSVRTFQMDRMYEEAEILRHIFNESLKNNWGHVPMTEKHVRAMARDLKMIADPRIILFVEVDGRAIGSVINLPNYNDLLHDCGGRLFPKGLYRMLCCRKNIRSLRGYALAILPEYQRHGIGALLVSETFSRAVAAGYSHGEISWILGSNAGMNELTKAFGGKADKRYALMGKALA